MKVLFVASGHENVNFKNQIVPFIYSQGESLKKEGIEIEYYPIVGKGLVSYIKNILPLRMFIKQSGFDIIHAHYGFCGWVSVFANLFLRHPIILSLMGSDVYGDVNMHGRRQIKTYLEIISTQILQFHVDSIIVKSKNLSKYIWAKAKMEIIPNGVDQELFSPLDQQEAKMKLNLSNDHKYLLFAGSKENPRKNFKLVSQSLKFLADEFNISVLTPYPINQSELVLYLNACDLLVFSSYLEGSPNIIKEAMSCNTSIVSTDCGDVKEIIDGTEGCFITEYDPKKFSQAIRQALLLDKRTTGRKDISKLEISKIAKRIIALYQKTLDFYE